jgi:NADH-quinone oxidoreductase subunit J
MMLDVDFGSLRSGFAKYLPLGGVVAGFLLAEMVLVSSAVAERGPAQSAVADPAADVSNTEMIGRVLYTDYIYFFQAAGMILLVAMIGAIVLTLRRRPGVKRQDISAQTARTPAKGMAVVQVKSGEGIAE